MAYHIDLYKMLFKDLTVYKKSLQVISEIELNVLSISEIDPNIKDQIKRAANSIILNIAEGSGRFSPADRKNFFVIARGSVFECSAALDKIEISHNCSFIEIKSVLEEISKMLFRMISNLTKNVKGNGIKSIPKQK
jgi:four helix bundle protein